VSHRSHCTLGVEHALVTWRPGARDGVTRCHASAVSVASERKKLVPTWLLCMFREIDSGFPLYSYIGYTQGERKGKLNPKTTTSQANATGQARHSVTII
jgi:hypothetical protein